MNLGKTLLHSTAAMILLLLIVPAFGQVTVEPHGIMISVEAGEQVERQIVLFNNGDQDVAFEVGMKAYDLDENNRRLNPRRDQPAL